MDYLNQNELDSGMLALASAYPNDCELIDLPHASIEGRTIRALRIRAKTADPSLGILFTGSVHAREWGGADILFYLASDLLAAYAAGQGLLYEVSGKGPGQTFSALQLAFLRNAVDLFIVPCVNPDGRLYSMTVDPLWRKNRNGGGVDINRNFDFMWDYKKYFSPSVLNIFSMPSDDPASDTYRGTAPNSEPETKNVVWLLDQHPHIRYFVDVHSYTGDVLTAWGDAPNQSGNFSMNFLNPVFDGKRGVDDVTVYGEHLDTASADRSLALGTCITDAIVAVTGEQYAVHQGYYLAPGIAGGAPGQIYPTAGTSDDYATSRSIQDPQRGTVAAFTIEFHKTSSTDFNFAFHPPFPKMAEIIAEIDAGLLAFCVCASAPSLPRLPQIVAEVLFGVVQDGGGVVIVNGRPHRIPPWDPLVPQLTAALQVYYDAARLPGVEGRTAMNAALGAMTKAIAAAQTRI